MAYATIADMTARFGEQRLAELTTRDGPVGAIDQTVLQSALDDAASEIDSYLAGRFALPLPAVPRILTIHAANIAWFRLLGDRAAGIEGAKANHEAALAFLRRAAAGEISLGDGNDPAASPASGGAQASAPERIFGRDTLKGF